jgi:hypothetical protein
VLDRVVETEKKEVLDEHKRLKHLKPYLFAKPAPTASTATKASDSKAK